MDQNYSVRNFIPLVSIFALITAFTVVRQFMLSAWDMNYAMYDFMAAFFIVFGLFKISNLAMFTEAYTKYDLIAKHSIAYALAYPFIEVALGVLYMLRWYLMATNWVTLVLMLVSAAGVLKVLIKGDLIMCACLGMVFKFPMTYVTLAEDLLMAGMAAYMLFFT